MSAAHRFAKSVPDDIRAWSKTIIKQRTQSSEIERVASRAIALTRPETETGVWRRIAVLAAQRPALDPLSLAMDVVTVHENWARLCKTTRAQLRSDARDLQRKMSKLAKAIHTSARALTEKDPDVLDTLAVLLRAASDDVLKVTMLNTVVIPLAREVLGASADANLGRYFPDPVRFLDALGQMVVDAAGREIKLWPTKMKAKDAARTYTMRVLHLHIANATGAPHHALVAELTDIAIGRDQTDPNKRTDPDLVAKNTKGLIPA
jgi:hypothetical protein